MFKNTFYAHFEGFWSPSYVMSKLMSICVNLNMSIHFLWTSSIVHVFDFLTFDIFLTIDIYLITSHLFNILTHGQWGIWAMGHMGKGVLQIEIRDLGRWGTWVMGNMGSGAHMGKGHMLNMCWIMYTFLNTAWILTKLLLDIGYWCILSKYTVIFPQWLELK